MKKARPFIFLFLLVGLLFLSSQAKAASSLSGNESPVYDITPSPTPTATPTPPDENGGGGGSVISQIFHHLVFPAETISEALTGIFNKAAEKETRQMSEEVARWTGVMGEIIQAPSQGDYNRVAQSSLPVAAALAPALFLLRLALYHWGRLLGDDDAGLRVVGDWVTAGALAIVAGPFLDLVIRLGWWMVGKVVGETGLLAMEFVKSTTATSAVLGLTNLTFLGGLISIGLSLGSLLAIAGLLFAFASSNAVLFILAVLAPPVAIASVLPQVRWLRSLWIKAVLLDRPAAGRGRWSLQSRTLSQLYVRQTGSVVCRHSCHLVVWCNRSVVIPGRHPEQDDPDGIRGCAGWDGQGRQTDRLDRRAGRQRSRCSSGSRGWSRRCCGAGAAGAGSSASGMAGASGALSGGEAAMSHLNAAQELWPACCELRCPGVESARRLQPGAGPQP